MLAKLSSIRRGTSTNAIVNYFYNVFAIAVFILSVVFIKTAQDKEIEEEQNRKNVDEKNVGDHQINTGLDDLLNREVITTDDESLRKLLDSSCINLSNNEDKEKYAQILPAEIIKKILTECREKRRYFKTNLLHDLEGMIDALFDDLTPFIFDSNINRISNFIDTRKAEETDKSSETYKLLSMIDIIVSNMKQYERELKLSEASHLHAFKNVLRPLLDDSRIILKDGETVLVSTQRMQIINGVDITYGRRIDILVVCDLETDNGIEMCSIEFKKSNVTEATLQQQQNKNLRINACILNNIHLFTENTDHQLIYFDFAGKSTYMIQLYRYENCIVGHKIGNFSLISSLVELEQLRKSVKNLYAWREFVVNLGNTLALSRVNQSYKYNMIEVSDYASTTPVRSPKRKVDPINVFFTPSNQSKRTKVYY
ncbi:hypothetical protein G6F46_007640 [Rhizopus delemar]|nr:hypothetical protein G6F55_006532 [Rhizopus delemar]KAG1541374.1 hypothetical protein G6F51_007935 [Rhizopus arrhizus]KAG1495498.1 hypothetical protein G6F54_007125 [Rhizopus delemar]KAG1512697.1 hypothetical protein G6F53_004989 [Rhizopus delemar]KAG1520190.1 hypothetical protein G6F52_007900 [Rhizopus delemar]